MSLSFTIDASSLHVVIDKAEKKPIGTAFSFLKPEWVVTAKHVVIKNGEPRAELCLNSIKNIIVDSEIYFLHPTLDIAILEIKNESPCKTPLFPSHERLSGSKGLICCGLAPSLGKNEEPKLFVNQILNYEREQRIRDDGTEELITFDAPFIEPGHSGGPVFGEGGGVVAIIIEGLFTEHNKIGKATGIHSLLNYLHFDTKSI